MSSRILGGTVYLLVKSEFIYSFFNLICLFYLLPLPSTGRMIEEGASTTTATIAAPSLGKEAEALLDDMTIMHQIVRPTRQIDPIRLIALPADTTKLLTILEVAIRMRGNLMQGRQKARTMVMMIIMHISKQACLKRNTMQMEKQDQEQWRQRQWQHHHHHHHTTSLL